MKSWIIGTLFQAFVMGILIQFGVLSASQNFMVNVITGLIVVVVCQVIGRFFS